MKSFFVIFAILLLAQCISALDIPSEDAAAAVDPNCQAACYQGRSAFIAWCKRMGPGAPCLALANAPPQLFTTQACLRYCKI